MKHTATYYAEHRIKEEYSPVIEVIKSTTTEEL